MPIVIGLDLGTTTIKALALNGEGSVLTAARTPTPHGEQQALDATWAAAASVLRQVMEATQTADAVALSGAMHTLVAVGHGQALTYSDISAAGLLPDLRAEADSDALYRETGCTLSAHYHVARLRLDPFSQAGLIASIKDMIAHRLCGEWATDIGMASTTGLLNIHTRTWSSDALALAGITPQRLPPLVMTDAVVGHVTAEAAKVTGLPAGIPVIAGTSDGAAATLSTGAETVITVGTSGAVRCVFPEPFLDEQKRTWCYILDRERWLAGGAISNGGLVLDWVRDRFYGDEEDGFATVLAEAATVPPGAEGLRFRPYLTPERTDPNATASLEGLRRSHTRAHIARAALEGVAFELAAIWHVLEPPQPPHLTGGITQSPLWAQIIADVIGRPLVVRTEEGGAALGAALIGIQSLGQRVVIKREGITITPQSDYSALLS